MKVNPAQSMKVKPAKYAGKLIKFVSAQFMIKLVLDPIYWI